MTKEINFFLSFFFIFKIFIHNIYYYLTHHVNYQLMNTQKLIRLIVSIAICQAAGIIGSVFTVSAIPTWYAGISKPAFAPPNWIFAPVWTTLFLLMGIALFLVWERYLEKKGKEEKIAISVFGVQLGLNILWSVLFFGLRSPFLAFIEIIVLWVFIALSIMKFYMISKNAAYLLVPYILWVSFAAFLNYSIWIIN